MKYIKRYIAVKDLKVGKWYVYKSYNPEYNQDSTYFVRYSGDNYCSDYISLSDPSMNSLNTMARLTMEYIRKPATKEEVSKFMSDKNHHLLDDENFIPTKKFTEEDIKRVRSLINSI